MLTKHVAMFTAIAALVVSFLRISDVQALEKPIGILLAAGDIATCANDETKSGKATAELIKAELAKASALDPNIEVRVLALGDLAYDSGTTRAFDCFNATWGQFKDKILPVPGNHDYGTNRGAAYFKYFDTTLKTLKADRDRRLLLPGVSGVRPRRMGSAGPEQQHLYRRRHRAGEMARSRT